MVLGAAVFNAYRKGDYRAAWSIAVKYNMPGTFYKHWMLAIAYGQLGEREAANKALQDLLALRPDYALEVREEGRKVVRSVTRRACHRWPSQGGAGRGVLSGVSRSGNEAGTG
jgi:hypothetical protein